MICHLRLLLSRKTNVGTISFNATVTTSLWLRELQWTFIGPRRLCTLVNITHVYTQKAAFAHYGVCTTALAKYLHEIQSFAKKVFIPMLQEGNLSFANHAFQISHSGCQMGWEGYSVLPSSPCTRVPLVSCTNHGGDPLFPVSTWIPCQTLCKECWECPWSRNADCKASGRYWGVGQGSGVGGDLIPCWLDAFTSLYSLPCAFSSAQVPKTSQPLFVRRGYCPSFSLYEKGAGYSTYLECPFFVGQTLVRWIRRKHLCQEHCVSDPATVWTENGWGSRPVGNRSPNSLFKKDLNM